MGTSCDIDSRDSWPHFLVVPILLGRYVKKSGDLRMHGHQIAAQAQAAGLSWTNIEIFEEYVQENISDACND